MDKERLTEGAMGSRTKTQKCLQFCAAAGFLGGMVGTYFFGRGGVLIGWAAGAAVAAILFFWKIPREKESGRGD